MTTGPGDRGRLRACHADREQVIGTLQAAFAQGRLTRDELGARVGQAFAARTYADLAALLADIPGATRPPRPPARTRRRPLAWAAVEAGSCLIIAVAAVWVGSTVDPSGPGPNADHSYAFPMLLLAIIAVVAAPCILGHGVVTSWKLRRSRGQLPPRPGPGGHALEGERRASTGHDPDPPRIRTDQTHADLRAHKSRQGRPHIPAQAGRIPRGARPAPEF